MTCTSGIAGPFGTGSTVSGQSQPNSPAVFTITGFQPGATCTVTEDPVPTGYAAGYDNCLQVSIFDGADVQCTITNTLVTPTPTPTATARGRAPAFFPCLA
jgi:hypothetical protein